MKKLALILGLLAAGAAPARAGIYYDLQQTASSATLRMVGAIKMYASAFSGSPTIQLNSVTGNVNASSGTFTATGANTFSVETSSGVNVGGTGGVWATFFKASSKFIGDLVGNVTGNLTGNVTGNADTATALAADGANCSAGNYPLGVSASGAVQTCTAAGIGDSVLASTETHSGAETFTSSHTIGAVVYTTTNTLSTTATANAPGVAVNQFQIVASSYSYGASIIEYTGLSSSYTYCFQANWVQGGADATYIGQFNNDGGSSYIYGCFEETSAGASVACNSAGTTSFNLASATNAGVKNGGGYNIHMCFRTVTNAGGTSVMFWNGGPGGAVNSYFNANSVYSQHRVAGKYTATANLSRFKITGSAGNFTGPSYMWRMSPGVGL